MYSDVPSLGSVAIRRLSPTPSITRVVNVTVKAILATCSFGAGIFLYMILAEVAITGITMNAVTIFLTKDIADSDTFMSLKNAPRIPNNIPKKNLYTILSIKDSKMNLITCLMFMFLG